MAGKADGKSGRATWSRSGRQVAGRAVATQNNFILIVYGAKFQPCSQRLPSIRSQSVLLEPEEPNPASQLDVTLWNASTSEHQEYKEYKVDMWGSPREWYFLGTQNKNLRAHART